MKLRSRSVEACFKGYTEQRTIDYLWSLGFSEQIMERFFRPFFGGIFLEQELSTPAAMFRFIFKMFGAGAAALPAGGIEAIARQLADKLTTTEIRLNTAVQSVAGQVVTLTDGTELTAPGGIIIACDPTRLLPQLAGDAVTWKSTSNLYFYSNRRLRENRLINLVSDPTSLINTYAVAQAEQDLLRHSSLPNNSLRFLKHYVVEQALPRIHPVSFRYDPTHARVADRIFLAGDQQLNGSLDAALRSGRLAAEGLLSV